MQLKKKNIFGIIVVVSLLLIVAIICIFNNSSEGIGSAGISLEEFQQLQLGMTQFEVNNIIDTDDLWNDDEIYNKACVELSKESNNSVYTYKYKYVGDKSGYAIIVFSVDYSDGVYGLKYPEVISKENFNLK